ncbi:hypothetical protein [Streptomyces zingiberis]|uniref:MarR family transcriptional regulator n=1 Tax=Streptomyces zingiberis TaxID=2053010 RepID=A0ABX1BQ43_9ACTN|nr:hypothetical protein [Streptomyces zingiberis]NJP99849.1 hypothetical protein [Streptomyces zingiberis]
MSSSDSARADSGTGRNTVRSGTARHRDRRRGTAASRRRTLPSYRAAPAKQINILVALDDLAVDGDPVQRAMLAQHVGLGAATVGDCMAFLADVGLLEAGRGQYTITEHGREFAEAWRSNRTQARLLLRPLLTAHWSAAAAIDLLADGPLPQEELARLLRAGLPGVPMRGQYMVEWLDIALIVQRDAELLQVRLPPADTPAPPKPPGTQGQEKRDPGQAEGPQNPSPDRDAAPQARRTDAQRTEHAAPLLGMSRPEIQDLPDARYSVFLESILQTLQALTPDT